MAGSGSVLADEAPLDLQDADFRDAAAGIGDPPEELSILPAALVYGETATLTVTGPALADDVVFERVSGDCTVTGNTVTADTGIGVCEVQATLLGGGGAEDVTVTAAIELKLREQRVGWPSFAGSAGQLVELATITLDSELAPVFTAWPSDVCDITGGQPGQLRLIATGSCTVEVSQAGDESRYLPLRESRGFVVSDAPPPITWNQTLSAVYGDDDLALNASASSAISYDAVPPAVCMIADGNKLRITGAGTCTVTARLAGDAGASSGAEAQKTFTVAKAPQTALAFTSATSLAYKASLALSVAGGSTEGEVSYAHVSGGCGVNGSIVTASSGSGTCVIRATKAGDENHGEVTAESIISLRKRSQTISWTNLPARLLDVVPLGLYAAVDSGLAPRFAAGPATVCEITGDDTLALKGPGTCQITASQAGDGNHEPAQDVPVSIEAGVIAQSIIWNQVLSASFGGDDIPLTASATSGLAVSYAAGPGDVCSIVSDTKIRIAGAGQCTVTASQQGDGTHGPAEPRSKVFLVAKAPQPGLSFAIPPLAVGQEVTLSASGGSTGGTVTYVLADGSTAFCDWVAPGRLRGKAPGPCTVTATKQGAGGNYDDVSATASVEVGKGAQTALMVKASGVLVFPGSVGLFTTGGTGEGVVTYQVVSGPCTVAGDQLTSTGPGACQVTATKAADGIYDAVTSAPLVITAGGSPARHDAEEVVGENFNATAQFMSSFRPHAGRLDMRRGTGGSPVAFMPQGTSGNGMITFAASAGQIVEAAGKGDMRIVPTAVERPGQGYDPYLRTPGSVDVWVDGRFMWRNGADGAGGLDQRVFLGETGFDYLLTESLLIGLAVRLDTNEAKRGGAGGTLDTLGWLAGPYMVWELMPGLQADAKLAYGLARNDISLVIDADRFEGSYDSSRWMAEAGLRGTLDVSPLRIEPGLRASFYRETAEAFQLSGSGGLVQKQRLSLLRIAFDPRVSYIHMTEEGTAISPYLSPQIAAEWQETTGRGEGWDVSGAIEAGLSIATEFYVFSASLSASGIGGDGAVSYSAGAKLTIPLN